MPLNELEGVFYQVSTILMFFTLHFWQVHQLVVVFTVVKMKPGLRNPQFPQFVDHFSFYSRRSVNSVAKSLNPTWLALRNNDID